MSLRHRSFGTPKEPHFNRNIARLRKRDVRLARGDRHPVSFHSRVREEGTIRFALPSVFDENAGRHFPGKNHILFVKNLVQMKGTK